MNAAARTAASAEPLRVAVVGHTNTGKTSLLRTLTRDRAFGEVSDRPATTRDVRGAALLVQGQPVAELYDTPGLEDSISLLEHLEQFRDDHRTTGHDLVARFLEHDDARRRFPQEAKAIRQVMAAQVALYVIDAREPVLGKYRDELAILAWCARPVVPVLNFVADTAHARTAEWREQLAKLNLHAVAEFDTVVLDESGEQRLFEKMRTLLDSHRATLDALIADRQRLRDELTRSAAMIVADLLIDAAACVVRAPADEPGKVDAAMEQLKQRVRQREQRAVEQLLDLFRFGQEDYLGHDLPLENGEWGWDLFNPETMKRFGVRTGGGAAAGAAAGLAIDAISGGLTLGLPTAVGAALGGLLGSGSAEGRRLFDRLRGYSELRCNNATLQLLTVRQLALVRALLQRGHASPAPLRLDADQAPVTARRLPEPLQRARAQPAWSHLNSPAATAFAGPPRRRDAAVADLADQLHHTLRRPEA
ncbi:MAG: GTPase/DUF3482 domain-containing protein [Phycisphaeraceae bacterium]